MSITAINGQLVDVGPTNGLAIGVGNPHRQLIQWLIPNRGLVEMYINPQSFAISESKLIKETRTKGGFILQYWGESLPNIDISGTTGSSGIEGINILRDIYRQEQIGFGDIISQMNSGFVNNLTQTLIDATQSLTNNPIINPLGAGVNALTQLATGASIQQVVNNTATNFVNSVASTVNSVANSLDAIGTAVSSDQQLIPTLAALATSVELWYAGEIFRGFFKEFRVDERAEEMGAYKYSIKFTVTRRTGTRKNAYTWNRSPNFGPANSDVIPLSFGALLNTQTSTPGNAPIVTGPQPSGTSRRNLLTG